MDCCQHRRAKKAKKTQQKCTYRSGLLDKLRKHPHKPPLPNIFFTNARSIINKMNKLPIEISENKHTKACCILLLIETWLHLLIPDVATGCTAFFSDRKKDSGKSKGAELSIYVHIDWFTNIQIKANHCSPDLEYLTNKSHAFYILWEFNTVIVTAVYIPLYANTSKGLAYLHNTINLENNHHPKPVHIIAGDFNHMDLRAVLPKFH